MSQADIVDHLKANCKSWFTAKELSSLFNVGSASITRNISRLAVFKDIEVNKSFPSVLAPNRVCVAIRFVGDKE